MEINHFFKRPSYHLGEQVESLIVLKNDEKPRTVSRLHVQLRLTLRFKGRQRTEVLTQQEFANFPLLPQDRKECTLHYHLTEELLVSSAQVRYELVTEVVCDNGEKIKQMDQIPILPPTPIMTLMAALEQLDLMKRSIEFDGDVQLFRFLSENKTLRFCDFVVVFTDQGIRLLLSHGYKLVTFNREIYLSFHWMEDIQQLVAVMRRVLHPIGRPKQIIFTDLYQKWIHTATIMGSYFSELKSLPRPHGLEDKSPILDLDDLRVDIFDDDGDEDE